MATFVQQSPLVRSPATGDMFSTIKDLQHNDLECGVSNEDPLMIENAISYFTSISDVFKQKYIEGGSYLPVFTYNLRTGNCEKVYRAFETLGKYPQFITPEIRLCWAACALEMGLTEECKTILTSLLSGDEVSSKFSVMIKNSKEDEKAIYEALVQFMEALNNKT